MNNIVLTALLFFVGTQLSAQFFSQDFSSSTVLADYISATPNAGQFDAINTSTGIPAAINASTLEMGRTTAGSWTVIRSTDLTTPDVQQFQINVNVIDVTTTANGAITFNFGSGFDNANTSPTNAAVHSRFSLSFLSTSAETWTVREVGVSNSTNIYTGGHVITFIINNGTTAGFYTAPDGSFEPVGIDKWDLWVDNIKEYDDKSALTPTQSLSDFKIHSSSGGAIVQFDNIQVASVTLPVTLTAFSAKSTDHSTLLSFSTASERNNSHFEIERSTDGQYYTNIGRVAGTINSDSEQHYTFTDATPVKGVNYYRLKQVDLDGKFAYSPVRSVVLGKTGIVSLYPMPATETLHVQTETAFASDASWQILDITGRVLASGIFAAEQNLFELPVSQLNDGAYILRIMADQEVVTKQFRKQ